MKIFYILILLKFQLIPLDYNKSGNLYRYLNPPDSIIWWETGVYDRSANKHFVYYCSDTTYKINLPILSYDNTYSSNYYTSFPLRFYLVYKTVHGKIISINKVEQLVAFVGKIDNLGEALFLAFMYGFNSIPGKKYGSYRYEGEIYVFNLYKLYGPPDDLSVNSKIRKAKIKVDLNGNVYEFAGKKNLKWKLLTVKDMYGH
jgi:hypothetical protein